MVSSFSQKVTLQQIHSLTEDSRFYYRRLKNNRDELEPKRKSKVAKIYFDASLQCGDHCYVGVPFVLKCESFWLLALFFHGFWLVCCCT
jgi:hypothetical protein